MAIHIQPPCASLLASVKTMRRSTSGRATNLEEDTRAANPEKDATPRVMPSNYGAEAVVAATVDVITGAEDDIGSLATLVLF